MKLGVNHANIVVCLHAIFKIDEDNSTCDAHVSCSSVTIPLVVQGIDALLSALQAAVFSRRYQSNRTELNYINSTEF